MEANQPYLTCSSTTTRPGLWSSLCNHPEDYQISMTTCWLVPCTDNRLSHQASPTNVTQNIRHCPSYHNKIFTYNQIVYFNCQSTFVIGKWSIYTIIIIYFWQNSIIISTDLSYCPHTVWFSQERWPINTDGKLHCIVQNICTISYLKSIWASPYTI